MWKWHFPLVYRNCLIPTPHFNQLPHSTGCDLLFKDEDGEDYEVELDPGEEVVLGRFGGSSEKITMKLGDIQDLFGITAEMKRAEKLSRKYQLK